jgi:hypothetical protein
MGIDVTGGTGAGGSLAPSAKRQVIDLRTANQSITTVQMGGTLLLQTGTRLFPQVTIPTFANTTVGSKKGEVELQLPPNKSHVAVFNSGTAGTDSVLEAVLDGKEGADMLFKATAQSATGAVEKLGTGSLRTLWPLDPNATRLIDTGGTLSTSQHIDALNSTDVQSCALSPTLQVVVQLDANNDVFVIATNCNADGTDRGVSTTTMIRSNANTLQFPQIVKVTSSIAFIQWWDNTATAKNEWCFISVTDAATPVVTVGAVSDDTSLASGDRISGVSYNASVVADFDAANNLGVWISGGQVTAAQGQRAYRITGNSGTFAATFNHNFTFTGAVSHSAVPHRGVSPATNRYMVCGFAAASDGKIYMLQYNGSTISQEWVGATRLESYVLIGSNTRIDRLSTNDFLVQCGQHAVLGTVTAFKLTVPSLTSGNNHFWTQLTGFPRWGTTFQPLNPPIIFDGEAILYGSGIPSYYNGATTDLLNIKSSGPGSQDNHWTAVSNMWVPMPILHGFGGDIVKATACVDIPSRRITIFSRHTPVSGNIRLRVDRYIWPKR